MDGRGRAFDNIFVERLWRTVKYEEVYMKSYETVAEAKRSLAKYSTSTILRGSMSPSDTRPLRRSITRTGGLRIHQ